MIPSRFVFLVALGVLFSAAAEATQADDATPASVTAAADRKLPHGKWPWFKKYRKKKAADGAQPASRADGEVETGRVTELAPPAPATPVAPAPAKVAPPPVAPVAPPAEPEAAAIDASSEAAPRAPAARRRRSDNPRAEQSRTRNASPVPSRAAARAAAVSPMSRQHREFDARVRRALKLPASWTSAPPVREITSSATTIAALEPLEARLRALDAAPRDEASARTDFAAALLQRGLGRASAAESLAALALDATLAPAWNNLATVLRREGATDLAVDALEQSMALEPQSGIPHFSLAMILDHQGRRKDADAAYLRALELEPRLWLPGENPLIVGNTRALRALHQRYLKANEHGGLVIDTTAR